MTQHWLKDFDKQTIQRSYQYVKTIKRNQIQISIDAEENHLIDVSAYIHGYFSIHNVIFNPA